MCVYLVSVTESKCGTSCHSSGKCGAGLQQRTYREDGRPHWRQDRHRQPRNLRAAVFPISRCRWAACMQGPYYYSTSMHALATTVARLVALARATTGPCESHQSTSCHQLSLSCLPHEARTRPSLLTTMTTSSRLVFAPAPCAGLSVRTRWVHIFQRRGRGLAMPLLVFL